MKRFVVFLTLAAALGPACKKAPESQANLAREPAVAAPELGSRTGKAPANSNAPAATLPRPLLWAAEKDGVTTYFFGTMHVGVDAETRLPPLVWSKLGAARTFAMEANLDDAQTSTVLRPTQRSLRRELGDTYWKKLEDALGPSVASAVDHLPAMVPAAALSLRGLPPTPPMDKVLATRATSGGKPIVFLESADRQLALLARWMDAKALRMMLDELPGAEARVQAMLAAYLEGDERKLLALGDGEREAALRHGYTEGEYDQQMNDLLYQRNASWIEPIERLHAGGGGFVAVGALHLIGPRSVLELLAGKGYRVTRLAP